MDDAIDRFARDSAPTRLRFDYRRAFALGNAKLFRLERLELRPKRADFRRHRRDSIAVFIRRRHSPRSRFRRGSSAAFRFFPAKRVRVRFVSRRRRAHRRSRERSRSRASARRRLVIHRRRRRRRRRR